MHTAWGVSWIVLLLLPSLYLAYQAPPIGSRRSTRTGGGVVRRSRDDDRTAKSNRFGARLQLTNTANKATSHDGSSKTSSSSPATATAAGTSTKPAASLRDYIEMNQKLTAATTWEEILQLVQPYVTKVAAGNQLNSINLTTALHRLTRHAVNSNFVQNRQRILADARFALLVCCAVEQCREEPFGSRNASNICWSLAKLKLPPPVRAMAIHDGENGGSASTVRQQVLAYARDPTLKHHWIPELSKLAGRFLDDVGDAIVKDPSFLEGMMQESTNFLWTFASADRARPEVFRALVETIFRPNVGKPQEWSNSVWAFATSLTYDASHDVLLSRLCERLQTYEGFCKEYKTQEISNTIWGVATLIANTKDKTGRAITPQESSSALSIVRILLQELVARKAIGFRTQELANTAWAIATIGFGMGKLQHQGTTQYIVLKSDEMESDRTLMLDAIRAIVEQARNSMDKFRPQEINNLSWVLGRTFRYNEHYHGDLKASIEDLFQKMANNLANPRRKVMGQDLGTTVWGMAALGYKDEVSYRKILSRFSPDRGSSYKPQELSNSVWALATAEFDIEHRTYFDTMIEQKGRPSSLPRDSFLTVLHLASQELIRRPEQFKTQEIKDTVWGFVTLKVRHPALLKAVAEHMVGPVTVQYPQQARTFETFSTQGLGNLAWAYARHAQLAEGSMTNVNGVTGKLANYIASSADLGQVLMRKFFSIFADTALRKHDKLRKLASQDIANAAWALGILGLKHEPFVQAAIEVFIERSTLAASRQMMGDYSFAGQETANLFWAAAMLNVPQGKLLEAGCKHLLAQSKSRQPSFFAGPEVGGVAWACSAFNEFPDPLLSNVYNCLFSRDSKHEVEFKVATTMIFTQIALSLKDKNTKYRLPDNFPSAWIENMSTSSMTNDLDGFPLTQVTTSKIQSSIAATLESIGFSHVEEYTITMQDLAEQYGLAIPAQAIEVFSLDIAVPEQKIAIEVDGPTHFVTRIDGPLAPPCTEPEEYNIRKDGTRDYVFDWDGAAQEPNGATVLKQRLLNALGWKVAHIPFWKWAKGYSEEARKATCLDALREVGVNIDDLQ